MAEERFDFRLDSITKERIERAATLSEVSVSKFIRDAAAEKANSILVNKNQTTTVMSVEQFDELLSSLDTSERVIEVDDNV